MKREAHLNYIRGLPCTICGNPIETEAAHIRFADARAGKPITGMGTKSDDLFALPLCNRHHAEQHQMGERQFWKRYAIDPIFVALALWSATGDHERGTKIVQAACLTTP